MTAVVQNRNAELLFSLGISPLLLSPRFFSPLFLSPSSLSSSSLPSPSLTLLVYPSFLFPHTTSSSSSLSLLLPLPLFPVLFPLTTTNPPPSLTCRFPSQGASAVVKTESEEWQNMMNLPAFVSSTFLSHHSTLFYFLLHMQVNFTNRQQTSCSFPAPHPFCPD